MNLRECYDHALKEHGYSTDAAQLQVIDEMQRIADALARPPQPQSFWQKLWGQKAAPEWIPGLYCWGGVGRGKTFMMDLFCAQLPGTRKRRRHFHRFMNELHEGLTALGEVEDPLYPFAANLKRDIDVLCLDEFFVSDITDAMLLARLLQAMQHYGITLVTTSNIDPDNLYRGGLQRERFLPAIAWIKEHLHVLHIADGEDFRHRHFSQEHVFRAPDHADNRAALLRDLEELTGEPLDGREAFHTGSRSVPLLARNEHCAVFSFQELCEGHHSQRDYIAIGQRFPYVGLVGVKEMGELDENAARRFLVLIDEFYDRRVKLLLSCQQPVTALYQGQQLRFEFERLQSRLFEMQSAFYWQEPHLL